MWKKAFGKIKHPFKIKSHNEQEIEREFFHLKLSIKKKCVIVTNMLNGKRLNVFWKVRNRARIFALTISVQHFTAYSN